MPPIQGLSRQPNALLSVSRINLFSTLSFLVAFSTGFFMQFNVMTAAFGLPFLRLTDALLFLFIPCLFVSVGPGNTVRYGLLYFVMLLALVMASLLFKTGVEQGDTYLTLILLASGVLAFYFAHLARDERFLVWFSVGICLGLLPSLLVLFLQAAAGAKAPLAAIGLGVPAELLSVRAARATEIKLGGIWAAGNEAGHVYSLATASALYLALKLRRPFIYITAYVLLVASFALTLNRAGMIAPTLGLLYLYYRLGNFFLYAKTALMGLCVATILLSYANVDALDSFYDAIENRFLSDSYVETNASERFDSTIAGLEIAFENPFGIGNDARVSQVLSMTADAEESVHNGFLSLAFQSGLFISLLYILSGIYLLIQRKTVHPLLIIMFLFTASSMFFEEVTINPFFIFSITITIASAWLHYARKPRRSPAAVTAPRSIKLANQQAT